MSKEENGELPTKQGVIVPLDVRCGHCYHFEKQKALTYPDVCSKLGVLKIGRPCKYYLANVNSMSLSNDEGKTFASFLEKIPSTKLAAFASLINQEVKTRRQGFRHGQEVFIKIYPDEYLNNYVKAWVMLAHKHNVIVQGIKTPFRGWFLKSSVLTKEQFDAKKKGLIARKRINDPNRKKYINQKIKELPKAVKDYVPPTIDDLEKVPVSRNTRKSDLDVIKIRGTKNAND